MPDITRATFTPLGSGSDGTSFEVHFNPSSLDYTITNQLQGGNGRRAAQYVAQSTGKLSMELLFDTTDSGEDVRVYTEKVAKLMVPGGGGRSRRRPPPPRALFEWGSYSFEGIVETFREKIDFFSTDGVPLRASVSVSLSRQDLVFEAEEGAGAGAGGALGSSEDDVEARMGSGDDVDDVASSAGDAGAARAIAAANGFESIRSPGAAVVRLGASVTLAPPVAFAAGGGLGLRAGVSLGEGPSFGAAAGLDVDFGASASTGGGASLGADARLAGAADASGMAGSFLQSTQDLGSNSPGAGASGGGKPGSGGKAPGKGGARGGSGTQGGRGKLGSSVLPDKDIMKAITQRDIRAGAQETMSAVATSSARPSTSAGSERESGLVSAGVPASSDPFGGLKSAPGFRANLRLDPEKLVRSVEVRGYGTGAGVGFRIGGQATMQGAASVAADVGRELRLAERIRFDRGRKESER
jgi:hypothetical protein